MTLLRDALAVVIALVGATAIILVFGYLATLSTSPPLSADGVPFGCMNRECSTPIPTVTP